MEAIIVQKKHFGLAVVPLMILLLFVNCADPTFTMSEQIDSTSRSAVSYPQWALLDSYSAGDYVTYNGHIYTCLIAHTAYSPDWNPEQAGSLWSYVSSGGGSPESLFSDDLSDYEGENCRINGDTIVPSGIGSPWSIPFSWIHQEGLNYTVSDGDEITVKGSFRSGDVTDVIYIRALLWIENADHNPLAKFSPWVKLEDDGLGIYKFETTIDTIAYDGKATRFSLQFSHNKSTLSSNLTLYSLSGTKKSGDEIPGEFPFPMRRSYSRPTDLPYLQDNGLTQVAMEEEVKRQWLQWKDRYLLDANYSNCTTGKYVHYAGGAEGMAAGWTAVTVSEAHAYGMLLLVLMEGAEDDSYQDEFDEMIEFYEIWEGGNAPFMGWQLATTTHQPGKLLFSIFPDTDDPANPPSSAYDYGKGSAADPDMDMAYAFLLADKQWGSDGTYDYKAMALEFIDAAADLYIAPDDHLYVGGWVKDWGSPMEKRITRSSDFLFQHWTTFYGETLDQRWRDVTWASWDMVSANSNSKGLIPDFYLKNKDTGVWEQPTSKVLEEEEDGDYYWNACRTPWRMATAAMTDHRKFFQFRYELQKFNQFIYDTTSGDLEDMHIGYYAHSRGGISVGDEIPAKTGENPAHNVAFAAPAFLSAMTGLEDSEIAPLKDYYDYIIDDNHLTTGSSQYAAYYDETIRIFCMLTAVGNWW